MLFVKSDTIKYFEVAVIECDGSYIIGLTVNYEIRKSSDGSLVDSGVMVQQGNVYTTNYTFTAIGQYYIEYITPIDHENGLKQISVFGYDFNDIGTILEQLIKILGLVHDNTVIDNQVWEGCKLLSARVRAFPSKADADAETNVLNTYEITATYNVNGQLEFFKQVEV